MIRNWKGKGLVAGPDISHHKTVTSFTAMRRGYVNKGRFVLPVEFGITKGTEGVGYVDPKCFENAQGFTDAGIPFAVFHVPTINYNGTVRSPDVQDELTAFCDLQLELKRRGTPATLIPWLDIEPGSKKEETSKEEATIWIQMFMSGLATFLQNDYGTPSTAIVAGRNPGIDRYGKPKRRASAAQRFCQYRLPGMYISQYLADKFLTKTHNLGRYPLWVPDYSQAPPRLPHGWTEALVWQQENDGNCTGIEGTCDINLALADFLTR